jgi:hypothetical protein
MRPAAFPCPACGKRAAVSPRDKVITCACGTQYDPRSGAVAGVVEPAEEDYRDAAPPMRRQPAPPAPVEAAQEAPAPEQPAAPVQQHTISAQVPVTINLPAHRPPSPWDSLVPPIRLILYCWAISTLVTTVMTLVLTLALILWLLHH